MSYYIPIVLLFLLILLINFIKLKESFINQVDDINFINYKDSDLALSDRATYDNSMVQLSTMPQVPLDNSIDVNYSIINNNLISYIFKKSIFYFKINKIIKVDNLDGITIDFKIDTLEDYKNLISFVLLNPIYVEFLVLSGVKSNKFFIDLKSFTNIDLNDTEWFNKNNEKVYKNKSISFRFTKSPQSSSVSELKQVSSFNFDEKLVIYSYYIDEYKNSIQNIVRELPTQGVVNNNTIIIYDKKYDSIKIDEISYQFMNTFRQMYLSYTVPDLTFIFDIIVNNDFNNNSNQLINCIINNNLIGGKSLDCKNNILSCKSIVEKNKYISLKIATGDNVDCGYNNVNNDVLVIKLPKITPGVKISVFITLSSNSKCGFAKWTDINSNINTDKSLSYSKTSQILTNNYIDIFTKSSFPRYPLENTTITWNNKFISYQPRIVLGNINLLSKYNDL